MKHSKDTKAGRLLQLSAEVSRIAGSLAQLSVGLGDSARQDSATTNSNEPAFLLETVSWLIQTRRDRSIHLPADLFADPAWDILLNLFRSDLAHEHVPVPSACKAAAVPASTALRWLGTLEQRGLVMRQGNQGDQTRDLVALAPATRTALRHYVLNVAESLRSRCR